MAAAAAAAGTGSSSSSSASAVAAAAGARDDASGVVLVHPMVIMNITDHLTRVRQQTSATTQRVFGVLYGKQSGLSVEVTTSFELKYAEREGGGIEISKSYLEKNIQLTKEVFQDHELVGWYATGPGPIAADMLTHRDILAHSDNPVLLKLDSDIAEDQRDLPIAVFESIFAEAADGSRTLVFSPLTYKIQAGEAETVTLEAVANTRPDVENDSVLTHTYAKTAEAMRRLSERVAVLQRFLREVHSGKITPDRHLLRLVSDVVARIPTADSSDFRGALLSDVSDTLLTTLVAAMAKGAAGLSQVLGRLEDGKDAAALSRSRAYGAHAFAGEYGDYDMGMDMGTDA
ncbi:hypothetical protein FNF29_06951 [Cafeteria roenbergensis]|uniref:COP9 signalosome complex subunit 6 n=1 Tax=Cafeteria roenbergensis TaxID=33653 RepID=A0A5A8C5T1_CAFRO|nr:hypothetical protein FNF29_06951 [Cafeteria roenbergensis]|eukprot:KAA0148007.1 hypothetical protein FNF29_06951 [Cafeteria roenbergensis]